MNEPQLTAKQLETLKAANAYNFITNIQTDTPRTVKTRYAFQLVKLGFLETTYTGPVYGGRFNAEWVITDAGKEWLTLFGEGEVQ